MEKSASKLGTLVGLLALGAGGGMTLVPSLAAAQDLAYGTRPFYAEETAMCYVEGVEQDGILSVNSAYWDDIYVPCWANVDADNNGHICKPYYVLNVGDVRVGKVGGSYYSTPDAYFESGECGWATPIGLSTGNLYVFVGNVLAVNLNCFVALRVGVELVVEHYSGTDCATGYVETWDDNQWCDVMCIQGSGYNHMAAHGIGECSSEAGEPEPFALECRMPDLVIPLTPGHSYKTRVQSAIHVGGSWQYWTEQTGCFVAS